MPEPAPLNLDSLIAEAEALAESYESLAKRSRNLVGDLLALKAGLGTLDEVKYVRPDGRLSEAGVRFCDEAFALGMGPSEVARKLGVTVPAIVMRRQRWRSSGRRSRKLGSTE